MCVGRWGQVRRRINQNVVDEEAVWGARWCCQISKVIVWRAGASQEGVNRCPRSRGTPNKGCRSSGLCGAERAWWAGEGNLAWICHARRAAKGLKGSAGQLADGVHGAAGMVHQVVAEMARTRERIVWPGLAMATMCGFAFCESHCVAARVWPGHGCLALLCGRW